MTMRDKIKDTVVDRMTLFGFEYKGLRGGIDPFGAQGDRYVLFYNGTNNGADTEVTGFDAVMSTPFVDGHTLAEIADEIEITEW